ncbi:MAG: efflux RND transporter periplasmic adaptor subunit [Odoribacter sp.]|nr:efflux RND transporter periplasmic adaptor subunit [Odoribacter sp.]
MNKIVKRVLIVVIILLAIGLILVPRFGWFSSTPDEVISTTTRSGSSKLPVTGIIAQLTESENSIPANGTLLANEEVDLVSEVVGKVVGIYFKEGSKVKKGQLLLKVDDADLQAQLAKAEYQRKLSYDKLERQRILLQRESVSREAFDQAQTDYNVLEAEIQLLNVQISRTEIRAPFDGVMRFRYVSEGSYVQASSQISTIVDNSILKLEFNLSEHFAGSDLNGKSIEFTVKGNDKIYTAKVYAVDPSISVNTRAVVARAAYDNRSGELKPGMFAQGYLQINEGIQYIAIPTEAVVPEMEGKRLWVLKNGKATSVPVETESRNERFVEIISGIQPGDTVLTDGLMQVREGMAVEVSLQ